MFPVNQHPLYTNTRRNLRPVKNITHINNASEDEKASRETLIKSLDLLHGLSPWSIHSGGNDVRNISRTLRHRSPLPLSAIEGHYERYSVGRAVSSRNELKDSIASQSADAFLLRLYGTFGLAVNYSLRKYKIIKDRYNYSGNQAHDYRFLSDVRRSYGLFKTESISDRSKEFMIGIMLNNKDFVKTITNLINATTERYSVTFESDEKKHFFRISRVKSNIYEKNPVTGESAISVGNVVVDYGFLSVGMDAKTIIYRYSSYESSATHDATDSVAVDEEEVIYVIESNLDIKALNIAGFKNDENSDLLSSGELLVQPGQRFRVAAIGSKPRAGTRRAVVLEPVVDSPVGVSSLIDMFNGARIGLNEI